MKHLFICATPIQLINIINLKTSQFKNDEAVLYILNHSEISKVMYTQMSKNSVFTKVLLLETKSFNASWFQKYTITRYIANFCMNIYPEKLLYNIVDDPLQYDIQWSSYLDRSSQLFFLVHKKRNPKLKLNLFEDGLYSYGVLSAKINVFKYKIFHLLGIKNIMEEVWSLYVYEPSLVKVTNNRLIEIKQISKIANNSELKNLFNKIFSFEKKSLDLLNYKYIFFDAPISIEELNKKQIDMMYFCIKELGDNLRIKLHPRSLLKVDKFSKNISDIKVPLEILCLNADVTHNVFISVFSTVGITPKLMFNQEPTIIFLYKILDLDKVTYFTYAIECIDIFKGLYSDSRHSIFIPESMEELQNILNDLEKDIDEQD